MIDAILRGQIAEAFWLNPVAFVLVIIMAVVGGLNLYNLWAKNNKRPRCAEFLIRKCTSGTSVLFLVIILLLWGIIRNN